MWCFFTSVRQSWNVRVEQRQLEREIVQLEAAKKSLQIELRSWQWQKDRLEKQLYALQTDDIRGIVDQYYSSREDYQLRIQVTKESLTFYTAQLRDKKSDWEMRIEGLEQQLQEKRVLLVQYTSPSLATTPAV